VFFAGLEPRHSVVLSRMVAAGHVTPEVTRWLVKGFGQFLKGEPLDVALDLDRGHRVRLRNDALLSLARALDGDFSAWHLAQSMSQAIARFEAQIWPRARHQLLPADGLGEIDAVLFWAFSADAEMIRNQRALYRFLGEMFEGRQLTKNCNAVSSGLAPCGLDQHASIIG